MRRFIVGMLAAACLTGISAAPGFAAKAAKPSGGSTSTLQLVVINSSDGLPHWNGQVTFKVSTTATDRPYVQLDCSQNGVLVYSDSAGYYPDYSWPWDQTMTLASNSWTGGAADCVAKMFYFASGGKTRTLTTLSFPVYA
jgi:hypothetical protein